MFARVYSSVCSFLQAPVVNMMPDPRFGRLQEGMWVRNFAEGIYRFGDCHRAICMFSKDVTHMGHMEHV